MAETSPLLTTEDLARILAVNVNFLSALRRFKIAPPVAGRAGVSYLYHPDDIRQWLERYARPEFAEVCMTRMPA